MRNRVQIDFSKSKCKVKSEFACESDPNVIMKKYFQTGQVPTALVFNQRRAQFGDFANSCDFTQVMQVVDSAKIAFESLPSAIRDKFGSDPIKFFEWYNNPANIEECVKLGLRDKSELPVKESVQTDVPEPGSTAPAGASAKVEQLA